MSKVDENRDFVEKEIFEVKIDQWKGGVWKTKIVVFGRACCRRRVLVDKKTICEFAGGPGSGAVRCGRPGCRGGGGGPGGSGRGACV